MKTIVAAMALILAGGSVARAQPAPTPSMILTAIEVSDLAKSEAFYMNALGMKKLMRLSKPTDPFVKDAFNFSGDPTASEPLLILMHHDKPEGAVHASGLIIGMHVADVHSAAKRVREAGFTVSHEPAADDTGPKLTTHVNDPDGNPIELVQFDPARMR